MNRNAMVTVGIVFVLLLASASAVLLRRGDPPRVTDWAPLRVTARPPTVTPTAGWWGDLPTPAPLMGTPAPTQAAPPTATPTMSPTAGWWADQPTWPALPTHATWSALPTFPGWATPTPTKGGTP